MKYIDADKLLALIDAKIQELGLSGSTWVGRSVLHDLRSDIASLQQDKDVLDLCSRIWWEDRGWIMIPPNVTLKGIESLLERVRHKIKWNEENGIEEQEQPESELEKAARYVYESWMGGTMDDVRRDIVGLGKVLNARKKE